MRRVKLFSLPAVVFIGVFSRGLHGQGLRDTSHPPSSSKFLSNLPPGFKLPDSAVGKRLLRAYGAALVSRGGTVPPPVLVFSDGESVDRWQKSLKTEQATIGGVAVRLQAPALRALLAAREDARKTGREISPRGRDAARRSYGQTVELWKSRVNPGLDWWVKKGRLSASEASRLRGLALADQVREVLKLEEHGLFFSPDFSRTILSSVAPPGASQHLSMLAFDVKEHENPRVRSVLARHGWFQTVLGDLTHFTYLGAKEDQLPSLGLKTVMEEGRVFWVPDL